MAQSPLDAINSRIAAAERYKNRMQNQGKTAQFAGASAKLDEYYRQRNELSGTNPLADVSTQDSAPAQLNPPGSGWVYDDDRGGFIPPVGEEGTSTVEGGPVSATQPDIYSDPVYLTQLQYGQNAFNMARINALGDKERATLGIQDELAARVPAAEQARRRLAGNYAARGMGGGRSGALSRAEAQQNAQELTARTSLRDQISELNRQFVANYGAEGSDWLGTAAGATTQSGALQAAINARLAGITTVG